MTTNIVVNNNIVANNNNQRNEVQFMNELLSMSPDQICDHISSLILSCESKKEDLLKVKRQLEGYRRDAKKHDKKYKQKKLRWTGIKCVALACGGTAVFIPGIGWIAGGLLFAANVGVNIGLMIADYQSDKKYEKEISEMIQKIEVKANDVMSIAETVITKQEEFDRQRMILIDQGFESDHAAIILIMAMLTSQFQSGQQTSITLTEEHNFIKNASMSLLIPKEKVAEWAAKLANKGIIISEKFIGKFCVAVALVGIVYNVYTYAKVCLDTNKAREKAKELIEVLDKGMTSTEYFIRLLTHLRDNISRHNMSRQLDDMSAQMHDFEDRLNHLITDCGLNIANELDSLQRQQNNRLDLLQQQNYSIIHSINCLTRAFMNQPISDRNHLTDGTDTSEIINSIESVP